MKIVFILLLTLPFIAYSKEGMWLPTDIQQLPIAEEGCGLTANELFSPDSTSVSKAIVGLGSEGNPFRFFCTAEFISANGLLMTNYHCGTRMIQKHSTVGANIFTDGYWAHSPTEELRNEGLTASVLISMDDVTDSIVRHFTDSTTETSHTQIIDSVSELLEASVDVLPGEEVQVKSFYEGNRFYLMRYKTYKDVRLVGVPSKYIGKFGGETDNWEWPRHTGDFCVLRVYADSSGNPAIYDSSNVPLRPAHYLPVSKDGVKDGDFSFIMGFPGSTNRYMPSDEIKQLTEVEYTERVKIREAKLAVLDEYMSADESVYIKYYVKNQGIANYYKNFKGQIQSVRFHDVVAKKQAFEAEVSGYLHENQLSDTLNVSRIEFGTSSTFRQLYAAIDTFTFAESYFQEALFRTSATVYVGYKFEKLRNGLKESADSSEFIATLAESLQPTVDDYYGNFEQAVDKALFITGLSLAYDRIPDGFRPEYFSVIEKKFKGNIEKFADWAYKVSIFRDRSSVETFLSSPKLSVLEKDPIFRLAISSIYQLRAIRKDVALIREDIAAAKRQFVGEQLQYAMKDTLATYPDANSTLRFTYGHVGGYVPRDAVYYKHATTVQGILEKYDPDNKDYFVPDSMISVLRDTADLPVCFITDNDITGGNSGSPVMNARGELIGVAFDGNLEAMSGDILFDPQLQRCINADIRYVLYIIEQFGKCSYILNDLDIK